ncbi:MAG: GIY-YIG nuclease family protein [Planctomycetes bacterium]|nr:GIY-YIG nuclease family protein [Planctomycetota bacterium]
MPGTISALVYLLRCRDGTLYCGWTTDVAKRLATHNRGAGAAYTRARRPVKLVWQESCADRSAALRREWQIKQLTRPEKLRLIAAARRRKPG